MSTDASPNSHTLMQSAKVAAADAVAAAAANAAKTGASSSEFWVLLGGGALSVLAVTLKAAALIPGPWQVPAFLGSVGVSAGAYALARGQVKQGALTAAAAMVREGIQLAQSGAVTGTLGASSPKP